jgi:hypothetical protein
MKYAVKHQVLEVINEMVLPANTNAFPPRLASSDKIILFTFLEDTFPGCTDAACRFPTVLKNRGGVAQYCLFHKNMERICPFITEESKKSLNS